MNRLCAKEVTYNFSKTGNAYNVSENENFKQPHYFIKQRGSKYSHGLKKRIFDLAESYSIDKIEFKYDDLIVDVGANCGDLILYFADQRYIGFEPSPAEFEVLKKNSNLNCKVFNFAVSDVENETEFFVSSEGADSSLHKPLKVEKIIKVKQIRLDKFINEKVKLLKVDAEGAEIEVINGAKNLLSRIEFIAIDLGFEKGIKQETTAPPVFNFLFKNNFVLLAIAKNERYLFQNQNFHSIELQKLNNRD